MAAPHSIDADKAALRARMRKGSTLRSSDETGAVHEAVLTLAAGARRVAAFIPFDDEPDLRPLFPRIEAGGARVLLPVIVARGVPLLFRPWVSGRAIVSGPLGTWHPADGPEEVPDLVLVPLLAFDRVGRRLGRGAGFYDRTLAALPDPRIVGVAWSDREVATVPAALHDVALHAIATEHGPISFATQRQ